jgi:uncharacterized protein YjeT (DUF2065 family)
MDMLVPFMSAVGLMLVLEGLMPFAAPRGFRRTLAAVMQADDRILRLVGLLSMAVGLGVLYVARS